MIGFTGYVGAFRHGGFCCGVTHIYGFGSRPGAKVAATEVGSAGDRAAYNTRSPQYNKYLHVEAPNQTAEERLHVVIQAIIKGGEGTNARPRGCIEVVLTASQREYRGAPDQYGNILGPRGPSWHEILIAAGFKEAMEFRNSNSGSTLTMYLLDTTQYVKPEPKKAETVKKAVKKAVKAVADPFGRG